MVESYGVPDNILDKVDSIIQSCTELKHLPACERLVRNLSNRFNDIPILYFYDNISLQKQLIKFGNKTSKKRGYDT
jgi:hypothetical protein